MADYRTEFPDFGELDVTLPTGFEDCSDHHEACPSFQRPHLGLRIYVGYRDPRMREFPQNDERFSVWHYVAGKKLLSTDEWSEVEEFVAGCKPTNIVLFDTPR